MKLIDKIEVGKDIYGCPDAMIPIVAAQLASEHGQAIYIARDDARMSSLIRSLEFIAPQIEALAFPAWDCLPYDRVSPHPDIVSRRIACLSRLVALHNTEGTSHKQPILLVTTINSWLQKIPHPAFFDGASLRLTEQMQISQKQVIDFLTANGFFRTQTVREFGEFSVRGGIIDIYCSTEHDPVRLDFFGDEIDSLKYFDSLSQKSISAAAEINILPAQEFILDEETISRFRQGYLANFGGRASKDPLYESVSAGQSVAGIEHWLSLLHENLIELDRLVADWPALGDIEIMAAHKARCDQIQDFYQARCDAEDHGQPYRPLAPDQLYKAEADFAEFTGAGQFIQLSNFAAPTDSATDLRGRLAPQFSTTRTDISSGQPPISPSQAVADHIAGLGKPIILAASAKGALSRMTELISACLTTGILEIDTIASITDAGCYGAVWPVEQGFERDDVLVLTEQDIFGARITRPSGRRRRADDFLKEVSSLEIGDLVVHVEHGIGRYEGLETIRHNDTDHDCLLLVYAGGDRLYLPVENIDVLSRYGQEGTDAMLDKLGGVAWQARKARIKGKIKEMADQLIRIAAQRQVAKAEPLSPPDGLFAEFCARFGYAETDDQLDAIADVLSDLSSGNATDRLICGDVGFGKTEVAMRAAFVAAMCGYQVALVTPTTLLARQHGKLCEERFAGFPVKMATLSRLTSHADAQSIKEGLKTGDIQIVVGTHALLAKSISFNNLGLLIIDEEQRFGVAQKERLKELKGDVHVLTLSATPIPRTLQLALSGVRQMSLISTPPVDRLAVRTFVGGWDNVVLKEAISREMFRGGQIFVVSPRISDLPRIYDRLVKMLPDARILTAHGQMAGGELDDVMTRFGNGEAHILLATNIIESGIDIPTANTMIIHRADMFGLSQLYQLRGRVGRGKLRAYAYLTTDANMILTPQARRRLDVMQTLDTLGAGFSLASYDMDIRGAGNLLGDEQSGHVKEVGIELYQELLRQAVEQAGKSSDTEQAEIADFTPQINLGNNVLIPEAYVSDLSVRLSLYRRISNLQNEDDINAIMAELVDRFGAIPESVRNLLEIVVLKRACLRANIAKLDAGAKGFSVSFKDNHFDQPDRLIAWIASKKGKVILKSDHKLVIKEELPKPDKRGQIAKQYLAEINALLAGTGETLPAS